MKKHISALRNIMRGAVLGIVVLGAAAVHAQNYSSTLPGLTPTIIQGQHAPNNIYAGPGAGNLTGTAAENTAFGDYYGTP